MKIELNQIGLPKYSCDLQQNQNHPTNRIITKELMIIVINKLFKSIDYISNHI